MGPTFYYTEEGYWKIIAADTKNKGHSKIGEPKVGPGTLSPHHARFRVDFPRKCRDISNNSPGSLSSNTEHPRHHASFAFVHYQCNWHPMPSSHNAVDQRTVIFTRAFCAFQGRNPSMCDTRKEAPIV